jgi:hypothetical protein
LLAWSMQGHRGRSPSMAALLPISTDAHDSANERPPAAPAGKRKVPAHRREQQRNRGRAATATRPQRDVGSPQVAQPWRLLGQGHLRCGGRRRNRSRIRSQETGSFSPTGVV